MAGTLVDTVGSGEPELTCDTLRVLNFGGTAIGKEGTVILHTTTHTYIDISSG